MCSLFLQTKLNPNVKRAQLINPDTTIKVTSYLYVRTLHICVAELLFGCTWSLVVVHSVPSAPGAPARQAARRPSHPLRPRRRACRGTARKRTHGSPWCTCPWGCTHLPHGRTSQKLGATSQEKFGK